MVVVLSAGVLLTGCGEDTGKDWRGVNGVDYVIVIGVDALSPDGIQNASTPYLDYLVENGASTFAARAVMPSNSSPNWASMIMGAGPEQHGVTSNSWERDDFDLSPTEVGPGGFFPTIFSLFPEQRPDLETVVFYDWPGFGRLFEDDLVNVSYMPDLPRDETEDRVMWAEDTMENAVEYVTDMQPGLMFIQLDHVDHFGHQFGHGSEEFYNSIQHVDSLIGNMMDAIEYAGIRDQTVIHITSDHGGIDYGHGGATDAEVHIPWIFHGSQVQPGWDLGPFINTYDTAATIAWIFGLEMPESWIAKPAKAVFQ